MATRPDAVIDPTSTPVPGSGAAVASEQRIFVASQWQLMWWRFRKHKVAVASACVVIGFYLVVVGADFLAYADPSASEAQRSLMPPQRIHWFDGGRFAPYVHGLKGARDPQSFKRVYRADPDVKIPIRFFAKGFEYRFLSLIPTTRHLVGVDEGRDAANTIFLLGTDVQGRDLWSRLMFATRISLTIGLVGVTMSLVLGVVLGGFSGFYGGVADTLIQRIIEILRSIPTIPLWMGLAAALHATGRSFRCTSPSPSSSPCSHGQSWPGSCAAASSLFGRRTSWYPRGSWGAARCGPSSCTWSLRS
jgi:peptide/nickel transport system permease protein